MVSVAIVTIIVIIVNLVVGTQKWSQLICNDRVCDWVIVRLFVMKLIGQDSSVTDC